MINTDHLSLEAHRYTLTGSSTHVCKCGAASNPHIHGESGIASIQDGEWVVHLRANTLRLEVVCDETVVNEMVSLITNCRHAHEHEKPGYYAIVKPGEFSVGVERYGPFETAKEADQAGEVICVPGSFGHWWILKIGGC